MDPVRGAILDTYCAARIAGRKVAVIGGGLAGLMAARSLARSGAKVTVYEARAQVGGRVLSDSRFANGRVTEAGAELIGSIHTRWCALAKEYGLALISRMDTELYDGQQLRARLTLDRPLDMKEIRDLERERSRRVLEPLARWASNIGDATRPWLDAGLQQLDNTSVASALQNRLGVRPAGSTARLWKATEHLLVNNNVARLEDMNLLALLCLVKGGQSGTDLMGYWDKLEIYRCADGCQRLALEIAKEVHGTKGCKVLRNRAVTRIDVQASAGRVLIQSRNTRGREVDRRADSVPLPPLAYDAVILAVPPSAWHLIDVQPTHPKDAVGLMASGGATKFFSNVSGRFWIADGAAPSGGSLPLGQVWEGTENQTQVAGQGTVLSVFAGGPGRLRDDKDYQRELTSLYPKYPRQVRKTLLVDWARQPFIQTGYSAPALGQVRTVGRRLNEPFLGRMFFAGEHTQMDSFGYMEGAIRSGERAATQLVQELCGRTRRPAPAPGDARVAGGLEPARRAG